jgi:hypothetical protein
MQDTKTTLTKWNKDGYAGLTGIHAELQEGEFAEYTEDLTPDELLRLALFVWNGNWQIVPEDLPALIAQEQEAYEGEFDDGAEFTEYLLDQTGIIPDDMPNWVCVDYEATWLYALTHDYHEYDIIDTQGRYRRFFWRSDV